MKNKKKEKSKIKNSKIALLTVGDVIIFYYDPIFRYNVYITSYKYNTIIFKINKNYVYCILHKNLKDLSDRSIVIKIPKSQIRLNNNFDLYFKWVNGKYKYFEYSEMLNQKKTSCGGNSNRLLI